MSEEPTDPFSGRQSGFHDMAMPEPGIPVGYAALIDAYGLEVPWPRFLCAIREKSPKLEKERWRYFGPRYQPKASLEGHLVFALSHEGIDLAVLGRLFAATGPQPIEAIVRGSPTGKFARQIWFLYEWLTGQTLDLPDGAGEVGFAPLINPKLQYAGKGVRSKRHRIINDLPGTRTFCPLVSRTAALDAYLAEDLRAKAQAAAAAVPDDVLARTAAFLRLEDSKASFAIEGERAPHDRIRRWGEAIREAGLRPLEADDLLRLQRMVIEDTRFVHMGLRKEGGFVGKHERDTGAPLPEHVSARAEDLPELIDGLIAFDRSSANGLDPVMAAAMLAFGFVYIHPFEDGNGRIHRYLIHHVLAEDGFNPPDVVFPVSAAFLEKITAYRAVLEDYSRRLLPHVRWEPTEKQNVRVLNDTADFYRYFDATAHAEFLFACVKRTIEVDLPREAAFLARYDRFAGAVNAKIDMPERMIDLLFRFLHQNEGRLSKRAREGEFAALSDDEAQAFESLYAEIFVPE